MALSLLQTSALRLTFILLAAIIFGACNRQGAVSMQRQPLRSAQLLEKPNNKDTVSQLPKATHPQPEVLTAKHTEADPAHPSHTLRHLHKAVKLTRLAARPSTRNKLYHDLLAQAKDPRNRNATLHNHATHSDDDSWKYCCGACLIFVIILSVVGLLTNLASGISGNTAGPLALLLAVCVIVLLVGLYFYIMDN